MFHRPHTTQRDEDELNAYLDARLTGMAAREIDASDVDALFAAHDFHDLAGMAEFEVRPRYRADLAFTKEHQHMSAHTISTQSTIGSTANGYLGRQRSGISPCWLWR